MELHWIGTFLLGMLADMLRSVLAPETTEWLRRRLPFTRKDLNVEKNLHHLRVLKAIDDAGLDRTVLSHLEEDADQFKAMISNLEQAHIDAEVEFASTATTQLEMNFEAKARAEAAERELDRTLEEIRSSHLTEHEVEPFEKSQRLWNAYREALADFEMSRYLGGSMAPLVYWSTYRDATVARRAELLPLLEER